MSLKWMEMNIQYNSKGSQITMDNFTEKVKQ